MLLKYTYFFFAGVLLLHASCVNLEEKKTTIGVVDNNRHYYPILSGQELDVVFTIKNEGENPLFISDIITSCGCLVVSNSSFTQLPAGKEGQLRLTYNSHKNVGFVKHYITLYGNFLLGDSHELVFDVNVVPDPHYTKDYEELHLEEKQAKGNYKDLVDGEEWNKGYYMDGDF